MDRAAVAEWVAGGEEPTAIDLFAGAGGLSLGLRDAGFRVLVGADSDRLAVESHEANIGGLGYCGDLSDVDELLELLAGWGISTVDLIAGGPPCQAFSRAGRSRLRELVLEGSRSVADPRAHLWTSYVRVVEALRPRAVLMENVPDLAAWDDGAVLIGFLESLRGLGYRAEARILEAWRHGVPQHRSRLFIVGLLDGGGFAWPEDLGIVPTLRDAIEDLPAVAGAQRRDALTYWGAPESPLARRMRRDVPPEQLSTVFDHVTRDVRPDDAEAFALLPEGGTYEDLPARLQRYRTDIFSDKYKRLEWDRLSRSITAHLAKDGYWYIHPEQHRTLSVREAARVQTFPDWFRFAGEPTHRYRQIGNAVPPLLAEALGRSLISALSQPSVASTTRSSASSTSRFREDLLAWHERNRRPFRWRQGGADPWHVLMAELCFARTRPSRVPGLFEDLIRIAPTPEVMADRADDLLPMLHSFGLGSRAGNVIDCARVIDEVYGGSVPNDDLELQTLSGVGDYVSQAVLCFGFGRRTVLLDTNTARIVGRLNGRSEDKRRWQLRLDLYALAGPEGPDAAFNHALLDLGAHLCRAKQPLCRECPAGQRCMSRSDDGAPIGDQLALDEVSA
jgi:DNA (cytosine-5)-methyltransferase 1